MSPATVTLLAPDEPAPVIEYRTAGASPFLLVCDHAGRRIPRRLHDSACRRKSARATSVGYRHCRRGAGARRPARCRCRHAALFAAGNRLQPAAGQPDFNRRHERGNAHSGQRERGGAPTPRCACANLHALPPGHRPPSRRAAKCGPPDDIDFAAQLHAQLSRRSAAVAGRRALSPLPRARGGAAGAVGRRARSGGGRQRAL